MATFIYYLSQVRQRTDVVALVSCERNIGDLTYAVQKS